MKTKLIDVIAQLAELDNQIRNMESLKQGFSFHKLEDAEKSSFNEVLASHRQKLSDITNRIALSNQTIDI